MQREGSKREGGEGWAAQMPLRVPSPCHRLNILEHLLWPLPPLDTERTGRGPQSLP